MKERPILFSAQMVRAILDGTKTQTRRAVRKQFAPDAEPAEVSATSPEGWQISGHSGLWWDDAGACFDDAIRCPYGIPGYRLWVRETWQGPLIDEELEDEFRQSPDYFKKPSFCAYRATDTLDAINADGEELGWRPSIHMPRWASRIDLEITGIRVERLQDISEEDAKKEGAWGPDDSIVGNVAQHFGCDPLAVHPSLAYHMLWESINGAGSWDANPWVWVVEFKRMQP